MKRTTFTFAVLGGLGLLAVAAVTPRPVTTDQAVLAAGVGFSVLPDGRGGANVEAVVYPEAMGFDKKRSLEAFKATVYPVLRANCAGCHSTQKRAPAARKLVRMGIDRHNCFGGSCAEANAKMLAAVTAWRDGVADMIPAVPRGVEASRKIGEQQVLDWIAADKAKLPAAQREFVQYASFHALHNAGVGMLNLPADATRAQLLDAMKDIVVGKAAYIGRFRQ